MRSAHYGGVVTAALTLAWLAWATPASAQGRTVVSGIDTFSSYCSSCHGRSATGDGPLAQQMRIRPANLTEIAKRNGGVFPAEMVERIIDGRNPVKGHGGGDMPVWGDAFEKIPGEAASEKIQALVRYLESIQSKP